MKTYVSYIIHSYPEIIISVPTIEGVDKGFHNLTTFGQFLVDDHYKLNLGNTGKYLSVTYNIILKSK